MKTSLLASLLLILLVSFGCGKQRPDPNSALRVAKAPTLSSFDLPTPGEKIVPVHTIKFEQAELAQVLKLYAEISKRSIICAGNLPDAKFTFSNETPMSSVEVLQALDTLIAAQGITTVVLGTQYIKVVPSNQAHLESAPVIELRPDQLPDSSSYLMYIVELKNWKRSTDRVPQALQSFIGNLGNSIMLISGSDGRPRPASSQPSLSQVATDMFAEKRAPILILRAYSSNVRRALQVLEKMEQQ